MRCPRKNFPAKNSPAGFSGEKPNGAGASQCYANDCGVCATLRCYASKSRALLLLIGPGNIFRSGKYGAGVFAMLRRYEKPGPQIKVWGLRPQHFSSTSSRWGCARLRTLREVDTTAGLGEMFGLGSGVFSAVHRADGVDFADGLAIGVKTKPGAYIRQFTAGAAAKALAPAGL
jgi:hypothetical protein